MSAATSAPLQDAFMQDAPMQTATAAIARARGRALSLARMRLAVIAMVFVLGCLAIAARLAEVSLSPAEAAGRNLLTAQLPEAGGRADITDRNGILLATSLPSTDLIGNPRVVPDPQAAAAALHALLPRLPLDELSAKLSLDRTEVRLGRDLTPAQIKAVNALGIPGIDFRTTERRFYPTRNLAAHLVGFTNVDGDGLAGIERGLDARLKQGGAPVALSVDLRVQDILRDELMAAIEEFQAIAAAGLVIDLAEGEVVAMVSLPDFDPYDPVQAQQPQRINRTTLGVYELGSVFKLLNAAMALDSGRIELSDAFDARRPLRIGHHSIDDFKPQRAWLTVPEILVHSSNIGSAQMALAVGSDTQQRFFRRIGLLDAPALELPERGQPLVPARWGKAESMTAAFGHGISVSPISLASAVATVVDDGVALAPTLLHRAAAPALTRDDRNAAKPRVISPETSSSLRRLMRMVVAHSQAKDANPQGYLLGGKTGTALKLENGRYGNGRIASFVGAFPITKPRYVLFAMVDEPKGNDSTYGYATGGWVAAPVVGRVVQRMAALYGIPPLPPEIEQAIDAELALPTQPHGYIEAAEDGSYRRRADGGLLTLAAQ